MLRKTSGRMETELTFRISVSLIFWGSTLTFLEVAHCLTLRFGCYCCPGNATVSCVDLQTWLWDWTDLAFCISLWKSCTCSPPNPHTHTFKSYARTSVWSQVLWSVGCQESSNLWTPRFLNCQGRFFQRYLKSNTANGRTHPLWYPPQRQESCLKETPFVWFPWSNWPPFDTLCRHLHEFRLYTLCKKQWFSASFSPNIIIAIAVTQVETTSVSSIQYSFSERLSSRSSASSGLIINGYMVAHLPFTSSGCLQALINLKSMIQHPRCNCITIRFTVGASEEALLHVTACRQRLAIHNHLQQGLLSCNNLRKSSFKHLPLVTWLKLQIV